MDIGVTGTSVGAGGGAWLGASVVGGLVAAVVVVGSVGSGLGAVGSGFVGTISVGVAPEKHTQEDN